jgi:prepilin-type N-terminal cleavage/methylation domain-containing protein
VRSEGFTLVEFVVVIVIIAILSIIAVPVYRSYIEKIKTAQNISDVKESRVEKIPLKEVSVSVSNGNAPEDKNGGSDVRVA